VFVIERESQKDIAGHSISFFDLISSDAKTRISIPKANVDRVGVRKLVTEQEFDRQVDCWIPDIKISKLHHKNRKSRFETMRQTGTFNEMGSVIVTIHYLINKTKATFEEKRMYDQIRKRLVNEIEIIKAMNPATAETLLQGALDVAIKRRPPKDEESEDEAAEAASITADSTGTSAATATTAEKPSPEMAAAEKPAEPELAKSEETAIKTAKQKIEPEPKKVVAKTKATAPAEPHKAPVKPKPKEKVAAKPKEKVAAKPKEKAVAKPKVSITKPRKTSQAAKTKPTTKVKKATAAAG
jgi:RNA polymerase-interacting CarD/CdnL/TRCF family regulator